MSGRRPGYKEKPRRPKDESRIAAPIPIPGELEIVRAFLNTVAVAEHQVDALASPRGLSDWLSQQGLLPSGAELTEADMERACAVRFGLRALAASHLSGRPVNEEAIVGLDRAASGARAQVRFERDGTSRLEPVSRDFDDGLGTLLGFVHVAQREKKWKSLKICANAECRTAFFDFTKNQTGKWCVRRCGELIRAREFRKSEKYIRKAEKGRY